MPIDAVVVDGRPGLLWMDLADVTFTEPFFQQTVDRVRAEHPKREERFTEFDALLQLEKVIDSVAPTGFIFHSSRCGSTLLANACRALDGSIVLSEANVIDKLIARFITDANDRVKESLYSVFLRAAVNALAQRRTGNERRLFVKFSCCSTVQLERIKRNWPTVPWIFLYRDPVETIVSNMNTVPAWLFDEDHRILAHITGTSTEEVAQMSLEERCARSVGSFFATAVSAHTLANGSSMLLNYNQLAVPALTRILSFFNIQASNEELERIAGGSRIYSKEISGAREFTPDADAKQRVASDLVRTMAERWAMEPYHLLEGSRNTGHEPN
jgi:hypothetical protein